MTCPICKHYPVPSIATTCPSCDSNLVGLILIDNLEEEYVDLVKNKWETEGKQIQKIKGLENRLAKKKKRNVVLWLLLLSLPLFYYFCGPKEQTSSFPVPTIIQNDSLESYKAKVAENEIEIKALNQQLRAIEGTMNVKELKYKVKEGDLLYDLGLLFYNDTAAWYQIALDNKIYDIRGLPKGDTITIKYRD